MGKLCRRTSQLSAVCSVSPSRLFFCSLRELLKKNLNHDICLFMLKNLFWALFMFYQQVFLYQPILGLYYILLSFYLFMLISEACDNLIRWTLVTENWTHMKLFCLFSDITAELKSAVFSDTNQVFSSLIFLTSKGHPTVHFHAGTTLRVRWNGKNVGLVKMHIGPGVEVGKRLWIFGVLLFITSTGSFQLLSVKRRK